MAMPLKRQVCLADNTACEFICVDPALQAWWQRFMTILGLDSAQEKPHTHSQNNLKIILTESHLTEAAMPSFLKSLPHGLAMPYVANEWYPHDLRTSRIWYHLQSGHVIFDVLHKKDKETEIICMWQALSPIQRKTITQGGFPFHAGMVSKDGKAYLISASGGTGKSTCCQRIPAPWHAHADDEAVIILDKVSGRYYAHPFPTWSDYLWRQSNQSWRIEESLPLAGIFFIKQAPHDQIISIGQGKAAMLINEGAAQGCMKFLRNMDAAQTKAMKLHVFDNACALSKKIPCHVLELTIDGRFWDEMEHVL